MDLKLPITIHDELDDEVIESTGVLDLASGEIRDVKYIDFDVESDGFPAESEDYDFTCGTLSNGSKDVEFRIEVDVVGRKYSITPSELLELDMCGRLMIPQTDLRIGGASLQASAFTIFDYYASPTNGFRYR